MVNQRQHSLNKLYEAYREAGDDDMNARLRIKDFTAELNELQLQRNLEELSPEDLEKFLKSGHPVTDEELDLAQAEYADEYDAADMAADAEEDE